MLAAPIHCEALLVHQPAYRRVKHHQIRHLDMMHMEDKFSHRSLEVIIQVDKVTKYIYKIKSSDSLSYKNYAPIV